jgi:LPXTG-motif cell wall-anchored protein
VSETTTTVHEQGSTTTTTPGQGSTTTTPGPGGNLPHTGNGIAAPIMFGLCCIAAGALLAFRRRRALGRARGVHVP